MQKWPRNSRLVATSAPSPSDRFGPVSARPDPRPVRLTRGDVIAGISVALVLIPQSLAYAELAGLPAYYGLYAAALPPLAAAFFASSRYLQTGPVAMTSLLTFGALSAFAAPFSEQWIKLAALLALVVGVSRVALGLVRGGVIAYFMSQAVLVGFTTAAAILIVSSQLPTALGVVADGDTILSRLWWTVRHAGDWELTAIVLSLITVALVAGGRRVHRLFPGVLIAVVVGIVYSVVADYTGLRVGDVNLSFPGSPLDLPWGNVWSLIVPGAVIALVGFAEPASIARIFAAQDRERWSPNRELISQGAANLASGLSGGFPVGGSFSRSSINRLVGGETRWSGAVTGLAVLAFLPPGRGHVGSAASGAGGHRDRGSGPSHRPAPAAAILATLASPGAGRLDHVCSHARPVSSHRRGRDARHRARNNRPPVA